MIDSKSVGAEFGWYELIVLIEIKGNSVIEVVLEMKKQKIIIIADGKPISQFA